MSQSTPFCQNSPLVGGLRSYFTYRFCIFFANCLRGKEGAILLITCVAMILVFALTFSTTADATLSTCNHTNTVNICRFLSALNKNRLEQASRKRKGFQNFREKRTRVAHSWLWATETSSNRSFPLLLCTCIQLKSRVTQELSLSPY